MVINESALLRAIKEDYRGNGYTVAKRYTPGDGNVLVIQGTGWLAEIGWDNVPPKVLGLIVEHLKDLPTVGNAFTVQKKETKTTIYDMVDDMPDNDPDAIAIQVHRTDLMYKSFEVWQKDRNNGCLLIPCDTAEMLLDHGRTVQHLDGGIYLEGKASKLHVLATVLKSGTQEESTVNYLSARAWV